MESRPPQESPRRTPSGRKPNGSGGSPTPPWLWLLLIVGFALIFWQFSSKNETQVSYSPWFLDQVEHGNIKSISIQGTEARGELRRKELYPPSGSNTTGSMPALISKFSTYFPSEESVKDVVNKLREKAPSKGEEPVRIEIQPPNTANTLIWLTFLLPTFLILGLVYFMMRRARDQFDGGILGSFVKSPAKRHDKSKQRTTFDEVAGLENAKSELQEIVEFLKSPEKFQRLGRGGPQAGGRVRAPPRGQPPPAAA